jgi:hypothetical protein
MKRRVPRVHHLLVLLAASLALGVGSPTHAEQPGAPAANSAQDVHALAARIDQLISARLAESKVTPAPLTDDAEFVRRVYLDVAGRIPLTSEVRAFLNDKAADKRQRLVERLVNGPAYVTHFTNVFRTLLVPEVETDFNVRFLAPVFEGWLRRQFADNIGYDRMVRELLTVPFDRDPQRRFALYRQDGANPLVFYLAKEMKAENLAASTARLFLGVRLECAQCHDHPFATWKRDQFWGQAAFFAGLQNQGRDGFVSPGPEVRDRRELAIPGTDRVVQASFLDGAQPKWKYKVGSRQTLAEWVTAAENPFFSRAAVNRLWAHFFGLGLVEPVDDFNDEHRPSHPELLDELARQFAAHGFDLKFIMQAITASQAYQRSSRLTDASQDDPRLFARMAVKRLSPDQFYDSLAAATGMRNPYPGGRRAVNSRLDDPRTQLLAKFAGQDSRTESETTILQALALMNGRIVGDMTNLERSETLAAVADAPFLDTARRVETLYLAALGRAPRAEETERLVKYIEGGGPKRDTRAALADVFWALLNSTEFILNH